MKITTATTLATAAAISISISISGCGKDDDPSGRGSLVVPTSYAFESRFETGSSVSYSGQVFRHLLIAGLDDRVAGFTKRLDDGTLTATTGTIVGAFDYFFTFDGDTSGMDAHGIETTPAARQTTFADVSSGKDLRGKLAGNDVVGQHRDWTSQMIGWSEPGVSSPESLLRRWFGQIETQAIARTNGTIPLGPTGLPIPHVYLTPEGLDLRELVQKFMTGAVAYSQGTDDYLDDTEPGKGINSDNTKADDGEAFSELEHAWDEAFGYFGAARDYLDYTDDEIAAKGGRPDWQGEHDSDADGRIDLTRERNWGHAVNAAKRDRGSGAGAKTDYTEDAMQAFLRGRAIITHAGGALSASDTTDLAGARDSAVAAWEQTIASTCVHYINELVGDMGKFGTGDYDFAAHAKHWSELKGFLLTLQFNPRKAISDADLRAVHDAVGQAPALPGAANADQYRTGLMTARSTIGRAYGFAQDNLTTW